MNNQTAYWLWIQQTIGYGSKKISYILDNYTFAEDFYRASLEEKMLCGSFTKRDINKLKDTSLENASKIIKRCEECQIEIVTVGDVAYPQRLLEIINPPPVLFVKGNKEVLSDEFSIAMVGTRNATPYGMRSAFNIAFDLAKNNVTVISGGALGIDTYSHRGALQADGKTVCVLGCGIMFKYLRENDGLKKQMLRKGAIISEYPPDTAATRYTFPMRNRIISGLSKGVLVIEAGKKSGSLITAEIAAEQNKDVFAVPGDISSDVSFGTNELIKDGAIPVTSAADVVEYYGGKVIHEKKISNYNNCQKRQTFNKIDIIIDDVKEKSTAFENVASGKPKSEIRKKSKTFSNPKAERVTQDKTDTLPKISKEDFNELSENAQKILLSFDGEVLHIDSLAERSGLPINVVHSAVTQLEMFDYIESLQGRNYKILVSIK